MNLSLSVIYAEVGQ